MEIVTLIAFAVVGILAGFVGGLLGLSGGVVIVPCLVLIFNLIDIPQAHLMHMAIGTSLAAMMINGLASTIAHHRRQGVMWDVVFSLIPGIFLGALSGSFIANLLSGIILQMIFGVFVALLGGYVLFRKKKKKENPKPDKTLYTWIGLGIGLLSSILGVGGGIFLVPLLLSYRYPESRAVGTAAAMGFFVTFLASMGYFYFGQSEIALKGSLGYIYLPAFIAIGVMTIFFAPLGASLAYKMKGKRLRTIFAATLIIVGILMIFQ